MAVQDRRIYAEVNCWGASLAAWADRRCIRAGGVAPPSHTFGILGCRALPARRLARLGATPDLHHVLLNAVVGGDLRDWPSAQSLQQKMCRERGYRYAVVTESLIQTEDRRRDVDGQKGGPNARRGRGV